MAYEYRLARLPLSMAVVLSIAWLCSRLLMPDNVATMLSDLQGIGDFADGQVANYRYVPAAVGRILDWAHAGYYDLILLWILFYSVGLAYAVVEFIAFVELPKDYAPVAIVAVAAHGYFADLHSFSMSYLTFGLAFLATGGALRLLREGCSPIAMLGATISTSAVLFSYQPFALILPIAAALRLANQLLSGRNPDWSSSAHVWRTLIVFSVAVGIFLVSKALADMLQAHHGGREVSVSYISANALAYLKKVFSPYVFPGSLRMLFPIHERIIYGLSCIVVLVLAVRGARKTKSLIAWLAVLGLGAALFLGPGPFNLLGQTFWPSPRSMSPIVFLHVGAAALLFSLLPVGSLRNVALALILLALSASLANQARLYGIQIAQNQSDKNLAMMISAEIGRSFGDLAPKKLAVVSDWRSAAQLDHAYMDFALSAFTKPWSNAAVFAILFPGAYTPAPVPPGSCEGAASKGWKVEQVGDVIVVCLR